MKPLRVWSPFLLLGGVRAFIPALHHTHTTRLLAEPVSDDVEELLDVDIQSRLNRALEAMETLRTAATPPPTPPPPPPPPMSPSTTSPPPALAAPTLAETRGASRLFLDTADVELWEEHLSLGFYHGVTTNPLLLERAGVECSLTSLKSLVSAALEHYGVEEFMCQAWGESTECLVRCGAKLAALDSQDRVVVKLPLTRDGIAAAKILGRGGTGNGFGARLCMTTCYNKEQAFVSAALGAEYVAPYLGRMSEAPSSKALKEAGVYKAGLPLVDGVQECAAMVRVIKGMGASTRVLVASLRSAGQLTALAEAGCDTFTFSPAIADELLYEPFTTAAAADFEAAALATGGSPVVW